MPTRARKLCHANGCKNLVDGGQLYCTDHSHLGVAKKKQSNVEWQRRQPPRESPSARGYDAKWRKFRIGYLAIKKWCVRCGKIATEIDHIVPLNHGGTNDEKNLQPLCKSCHSKKTMNEDRVNYKN